MDCSSPNETLSNRKVSQLVDSMTVELQRPAGDSLRASWNLSLCSPHIGKLVPFVSVGSFPNEPDQFNFDAVFKPGTQARTCWHRCR